MSDADPRAKAQFERFASTARDLGCDEDKERFEAKLGSIARQKPVLGPKEKRPGKKPSRKLER